MEAESRDAVFVALRQRGIKAIKVVAADGSKANGEVRGVRKRVVVAAVFGAAVVTAILTVIIRSTPSTYTSGDAASPRHQIYGDPVIVEAFERGDFDKVLTNRVDQMLAWFAQPGKLMCPKGTDPRRMGEEFAKAVGRRSGERRQDGASCPRRETPDGQGGRRPGDAREVLELRQIVRGMREEMAAYLANGNGTPRSFWRRLLERTQQEMQIYERTRRELEKETNPSVWEEKNEALRRLDLRTITNHREEE